MEALFRFRPVRTTYTVMFVYGQHGGGILASGLATRALFALLPGLLLLVAIIGLVIRDPSAQAHLVDVLSSFAPPIHDLLGQSLRVLADGALQVTIVGLVLLLWTAAGFFQTLDDVFAVVLDEDRRRNAILRAVLGLVATLLVLGAIAGAAIVGVVAWSLADQVLSTVDPLLARLLLPAAVAVVVALAVALAYRFIPTRRPSWGAIALPSVVVAILVSILTQLFTLIAPHLAGVASLYGAIAAVFVLLAWLQLAAQVILLGVVWVWIRAFGGPAEESLPWPAGPAGRPDDPGRGDARGAAGGDSGNDGVPRMTPAADDAGRDRASGGGAASR